VFVLEGQGVVAGGEQEKAFRKGDVIFLPPGERHQFRNTGKTPLQFLCLIPSKDKCNL